MNNYKTYYILVVLLFYTIIYSRAQSPLYDLNWMLDAYNSDEFTTTLDCSGGGVYYLTNFTNPNWTIVNSTGWHGSPAPYADHTDGVTCLALSGSDLYAGTSPGQQLNGGLWKSSNGGAWSKITQLPGPTRFVTSIATSGTNLYVGLQGSVNYYNGTSWTVLIPSSTNNNDVTSIAVNGSNIFAGIYGASGGVYLYNGTSWIEVNTGLTNKLITTLTFISGSSIVAGTDGGGVFYSSNNGTNWSSINGVGLTNLHIRTLVIYGNTLIAGTDGGVFYSTNYSSGSPTWTTANSSGLTNISITSIAVISTSSIVVSTNGGGVFYSTNYQSGSPTWTSINSGSSTLPSLSISSLLYDGSSKLYVGVSPKWRVFDSYAGDCCGSLKPSNVSITSGILSLANDEYKGCGKIESYNANYGYCYSEIYAQTPYTAGGTDIFYPVFWTYYSAIDGYYGSPVPCNNNRYLCYLSHQENDIFEPSGSQYFGTTNVFGYWQDDNDCCQYKTLESSYTNSTPLYSGYHKYAAEWGADRMIYYFDDIPIYTAFGNYTIQGLQQVQIAAGLNGDGDYNQGDVLPAYFNIDYLHYYKLRYDCSNDLTILNNNDLSNYWTSGVPSVKSNIIFGNGLITISLSSNGHYVFRAVNTITINGDFTVPLGTEFFAEPTPCNN